MSLGKLPGIKGLVSGSQGKRRFRSELSVDMIGPPLGDFRHTMHVGRGGDVFGDTSFLSSYGGSREPGSPDSAAGAKADGFFARTFRQGWKSAAPRPRGGSRDLASPPPDVSPIIKNAVSLPQLNMDIGGLLAGSLSSTDDSLCTYGLSSGFLTLPRPSRLDRQLHEASLPDGGGSSRSRSDSLTSFTVDLGPSLMTEVLTLIDSSSCLRTFSHRQAADEEEEEEEEQQEEDSSLTDTPVQSPGATSPSGSFRRTRPEEGGGAARTGPSADSPLRAEPVMEAERFQRAADVLSRHYGGGSFTKGTSNNFTNAAGSHSRKTSQAFSEEEEEIKV